MTARSSLTRQSTPELKQVKWSGRTPLAINQASKQMLRFLRSTELDWSISPFGTRAEATMEFGSSLHEALDLDLCLVWSWFAGHSRARSQASRLMMGKTGALLRSKPSLLEIFPWLCSLCSAISLFSLFWLLLFYLSTFSITVTILLLIAYETSHELKSKSGTDTIANKETANVARLNLLHCGFPATPRHGKTEKSKKKLIIHRIQDWQIVIPAMVESCPGVHSWDPRSCRGGMRIIGSCTRDWRQHDRVRSPRARGMDGVITPEPRNT